MAIYRLHKKDWEKGVKPIDSLLDTKKRKPGKQGAQNRDDDNEDTDGEGPIPVLAPAPSPPPPMMSKQRKGISSGLSTIITRRGSSDRTGSSKTTTNRGRGGKVKPPTTSSSGVAEGKKKAWWTELPSVGKSKGSLRL